MISWKTVNMLYLRWRIRRLEAQIRKLEEEWAKLKGGDDNAR